MFGQKKSERKTAVALEYNPEEQAPKIVATGKGILADKIVDVAQKEGVPVHEDAPLANTLSKLEIGEYIPKELYSIVGEVLVYVDKMDHIKKKLNWKK